MAAALVEANKTQDVLFLPSSHALRRAQGQAATASARSSVGGASAPRGATATAAAASRGGGEDEDEGAVGETVEYEGEEEEAGII